MKSHTPTIVLVIASMLVASLLTLRDAKAQSWLLEVKIRAPVHENEAYPYGSNSPPNRVVAYLQPGEKPQVISGGFGKEWPYWKVRLPSGQTGYLFAPDVAFKQERSR
jgi:hypothetical protein